MTSPRHATPAANFALDDVARLAASLNPRALSQPLAGMRWLERMTRTAEELRPMLRLFPAVMYEPLEPHYALLRALGVLDQELVDDLCHHHGWHGLAVAAWLALLAPRAEYAAPLRAGGARAPGCRWIAELAVAECEGGGTRDESDLPPLVRRLRAVLNDVPWPHRVLRPYPTDAERSSFEAAQARVRTAYRDGGLSRALAQARRDGLLGNRQ